MSNRRRLARERLEIYLVHLLLAYRQVIFIVALITLSYAIFILTTNLLLGFICLLHSVYLLLLSSSYNVTVYTSRMVAWIATLGRGEE